jgi:outer membrane protein OmpA-like peptidoglycan-associated protein
VAEQKLNGLKNLKEGRMKRPLGSLMVAVLVPLVCATAAMGQAQPTPPAKPAGPPPPVSQEPPPTTTQPPVYVSEDTRPATTTFLGDTGLWFVPTAEGLPAKRWSFSAYRTNTDREQGFTDYSHFLATIGYGIHERFELFGSVRFLTRIDRDVRPLYLPIGGRYAGPLNEYPRVPDGWNEGFGDIIVGGKVNLLSEYRQQPAAVAVRAFLKLPTGDEDEGVSSGATDFAIDAIVSKELNQAVELSGYGGFIVRGAPDETELSNGFRWGFGAGFPSRANFRVTAELLGEFYFDDTVITRSPTDPEELTAGDNRSPVDFVIGGTWIGPRGFFAGAGLSWALVHGNRSDFNSTYDDEGGDRLGFQARIGWHPGVPIYVPPPPPPPPPPPKAENRPPTVKARCEPCIVEVGKGATVSATATDPDGDPLKCTWTTPTGKLANPNELQTLWTAPMQEGSVPVTITCTDGKGGTASDTVTIQVVKPPVKEYKFEDVHFDFDRYSLRPEAARILDEAVRAMQENTGLSLEIDGHTCNIGTAEYNLALGERRATSVREYLTSRGIGAERLRTVSYGEERPKHDNAREETRRLNRRAELVVRLKQ